MSTTLEVVIDCQAAQDARWLWETVRQAIKGLPEFRTLAVLMVSGPGFPPDKRIEVIYAAPVAEPH